MLLTVANLWQTLILTPTAWSGKDTLGISTLFVGDLKPGQRSWGQFYFEMSWWKQHCVPIWNSATWPYRDSDSTLSTPPELVASACQKEPGRRHHSLSPVPCKQQKSSSTSASSSRKSHRLHCRLLQKTTSEVRAKPAPVRLFPVFPHSSNAELSTPTPHGQSRHSTA